ncbi:MAG: hypothetical protein ABIJ52_03390 [Pseudomonadota bacterium]|nr:hypothetical protein [Pseudomonadota bacterium]
MAKPKPIKKLMQTGFRVSKTRKKELEEVARLRGQSVQSLIEEAVELRLLITEGFWDGILQVAEKLKIPPASVVANMVVRQSCFQFAWVSIFGIAPPGAFKEFRFDSEGFLSGERLSEVLVKEYTEKLEKLKSKMVEVRKTDRPAYHFSSEEMSMLMGGQP